MKVCYTNRLQRLPESAGTEPQRRRGVAQCVERQPGQAVESRERLRVSRAESLFISLPFAYWLIRESFVFEAGHSSRRAFYQLHLFQQKESHIFWYP